MSRAQNRVTILIAAGGTGGHVYPALEIAKRLRALGIHVEWLGTHKGLEAKLVPGEGFKLHPLSMGGLRGKGVFRWLLAPLMLIAALGRSLKVLRSVRAKLVLGMGGYAAGPGGVAAWLMRVPLFIHEQNAVPGLTNRILSRLATKVMEAFPGSFDPSLGALHAGNPVRADICALPEPQMRLASRAGPIRVLVLGGSQGARAINRALPDALAALPSAYAAAGVDVEPVAFINDMAAAYAWADLVICRAGAMTVCEVAAAGIAAVLVPFPYAVDDHQTCNARFLSDAGAAVLVCESDLTPGLLCELLLEFASARERLLAMAISARRLSVPDAAERVTAWCMEAAHA
jgi:UDP-N-acetylglucosamine--N-acetylmuramyl-(pentapeptide) pyrophosphoryl-undecaprenol N-acetylglucosamine transferase